MSEQKQCSSDKELIIETTDVVYFYDNQIKALNGINIKVFKNEIVGIMGRNGGGKTTLAKHFNGILKPCSGDVFVYGKNTKNGDVREFTGKVGYVFQNPDHQFFRVTVLKEMEAGPDNFGLSNKQKKENIEKAVVLLDLSDLLQKHPMELDYAAKKKVSYASILAFAPRVIILDEPTAGLYEADRKLFSNSINKLSEAGNTVIIISNDIDFIVENAKRVVLISDGSVAGDGSTTGVLRDIPLLKRAGIVPPQISRLDMRLFGNNKTALSVKDFADKFSNIYNKV